MVRRGDQAQSRRAQRANRAVAPLDPCPIDSCPIDSIPGVVWNADPQTLAFTSVNRFAETLLGYPTERWTAEPTFWQDHIYADDRAVIAERAKALKKSGAYDLEYRMLAANGRALWVRDIGRILTTGARRQLTGIIVDLSRKRTEHGGLDKNKLWLREIIDTIPQQIWSGPADGTLDFCNARWRSELGLTLAEIQGEGWQQMLHPEDRDRVLDAWRDSVVNGTPYQQQERHRMADGQYRWFLSRGVALRDDQGRIIRWYGTNTDIEDQKRAEDELRRQERLWRAVFDNSPIGVAIKDSSGRILAVNSACEQLVGYSLDELRGRTCVDLTFEEDRQAYNLLEDELQQGRRDRFEIEKRYVRKNGDQVWVRVNGSALPALDGEPAARVDIVEDITARKKLWADLQSQRDHLRVLLDLSHELIAKLEVSSVIESVLTVLHRRDRWAAAAIKLAEPSTQSLRVYRFAADGHLLEHPGTLPIEGTVTGKVYLSGKPIVFRSEELIHEAPWVLEAVEEKGVKCGCMLPLIYEKRVLGVLCLGAAELREFPPRELGYLEEQAQLVAAALDHSLRFDELTASHRKLTNERKCADEEIRSVFDFEHIIGRSKATKAVLRQVQTVAPTDSAVLILGETGTGKELIARAIHDRSPRKDQAFVKVDCTAIPSALLESELFGHEKGAFTGAIAQKLGRIEIADRGTVFLDEIGDLPLEVQSKLLRVLQDRAFERLGSNRTLHLDLRVIAATNRDLEEMVAKGEFRADLYYRLNVFPIVIPPLRERPDDIPPLVWHYVHKYAHRLKKTIDTIPAEAMAVFRAYSWPGNVRELQHFMERCVVLTSGSVLEAPVRALERDRRAHAATSRGGAAKRTMEQIERDAILEALRESNWVVGGPAGAARRLGLKRTTLASRIERLGISRDSRPDEGEPKRER